MRPTSLLRFLQHAVDFIKFPAMIKMRSFSKQWMYLFRLIPFNAVAQKFQTPLDKLTAFKAFWHSLPAQGSSRWLQQRLGLDQDYLSKMLVEMSGVTLLPTPIGGSEIAVLRGEDKDKTRIEVIRSKLGLDQFDGNMITRWGKMFEPVINKYTEVIFETDLVETGSVPGLRDINGFPIQSYSPDGVGIVSSERLKDVIVGETSSEFKSFFDLSVKDKLVVLFEFKCPWMRIPDGTVPKKYMAQPKMGMSSLVIPEISIFGDAMFRRCSIGDFAFNRKYDKGMHFGKASGDPVVMGFIGIYDVELRHGLSSTSAKSIISCDGEISRKICSRLFKITQASFKSRGSNFYESLDTTLDYVEQIPVIVACCYNSFSNLLANEYSAVKSGNGPDLTVDVTDKDEIKIIWNVVRATLNLPSDISSDVKAKLIRIVNGCCRANLAIKTYSYEKLNFGADFGTTKQPKSVKGSSMKQPGDFDIVPLEKLFAKLNPDNIDDPLTHEDLGSLMYYALTDNTGIKFYYPDKYCYKSSNRYAGGFANMGSNAMDTDRSSVDQCRK